MIEDKGVDVGELIEFMWCNCGLDNPEPKYHSIDCTYRVEWEDNMQTVHMTQSQLKIAEEVTGWKAFRVKKYYPDELDRIQMQMTEEAYHYGKRPWKSKLDHTGD